MRFAKWLVLLGLSVFVNIASADIVVTTTIDGTQGPWTFSSSLNSSFQYGTDSELPPTVVGASDGFDFAPGGTFTITYLSGTVSVGSGFPFTDANGDTAFPVDGGVGSSGKHFPSFYMDPATYPINLGELVGSFANSSGVIVGSPFKVGDSASITVPSGATQLQLGINDDIYGDNAGSYTVKVTGPGISTVPEPSTGTMLAAVFTLLAILVLRRKPGAEPQRF
jgi:hypothetical protein